MAAVGACTNGGDSLAVRDLRRLVLQPGDLAGYQRFDEGPQKIAESRGGARADPRRFGREGGWKARYRWVGDPTGARVQVIESRVDLFGDDDGAREELGAARRQHAALGGRVLDPPVVGDEAAAYRVVERGLNDVRSYTIEWRQGRATASITANGFEGRIELDDVIALARKQADRIEAAS